MWHASGKPQFFDLEANFDPNIGKKWIFSTKTLLAGTGNRFRPKFWQEYEYLMY